MKKLGKLSLNRIKANILSENELKQILGGSGGYINCLISDGGEIVSGGPCAMLTATECQSKCMEMYNGLGLGCDCH